MRDQISSLEKPILATVLVERPILLRAMTNLLSLPNTYRVNKWSYVEALMKIWELFLLLAAALLAATQDEAVSSTTILIPTLVP